MKACTEYNDLTRRQFLSGTGKAALAMGAMTALLPRVSMAQSGSSRDTIVSVYLRGGCDGLSLCVPHGEDNYYNYRPTIAVPRPDSTALNKAIDLDGFFGISPAMAALLDAYTAGNLLFVHATGIVGGNRSHFDNMKWMETGVIEQIPLGSGWLGRHLATTSPLRAGNTMRGVALSQAIPMTLSGGPGTAAVSDVARYGLYGTDYQRKAREAVLRSTYTNKTDPLENSAISILDTINLLNKIDFENYQPMGTAVYPASELGYAFKSAAALVRSDVGVEAMTIDVGGFDTHAGEGTNGGWLYFLLSDLAASMAAFHKDLVGADRFGRVIVVVMSEFGRTVRENASQGTDHGNGNAMMVLGGAVAGGRVLADWPGLRASDLFEGQDLKITIDYRDVLSEIIAKRLDNAGKLGEIFPQYTATQRGVIVA
ncbi:MAG TPA: DUF1501 domain-containing protein [Fimbriimonas sp.]|nr:DUF1501 domain-containing protein [Fimbriimonas sp.]